MNTIGTLSSLGDMESCRSGGDGVLVIAELMDAVSEKLSPSDPLKGLPTPNLTYQLIPTNSKNSKRTGWKFVWARVMVQWTMDETNGATCGLDSSGIWLVPTSMTTVPGSNH